MGFNFIQKKSVFFSFMGFDCRCTRVPPAEPSIFSTLALDLLNKGPTHCQLDPCQHPPRHLQMGFWNDDWHAVHPRFISVLDLNKGPTHCQLDPCQHPPRHLQMGVLKRWSTCSSSPLYISFGRTPPSPYVTSMWRIGPRKEFFATTDQTQRHPSGAFIRLAHLNRLTCHTLSSLPTS